MQKHYREGPPNDYQRDSKRQKSDDFKGATTFKSGSITLIANFFPLRLNVRTIFQYHVSFDPAIKNPSFQRAMLAQHKEKIGLQYLTGDILFLQGESKYLKLESVDRDGNKYLIVLKPTKMIEPAQHANVEELKNIFNNIVKRELAGSGLTELGRRGYLYDTSDYKRIDKQIDVLLGFSTSVVSLKGGIFLNVADISKVIRRNTALEFLNKSDDKKLIKGRIVITNYLPKKTYRIEDVDNTKTPDSKFIRRVKRIEGGKKVYEEIEISFAKYYEDTYKKYITDRKQPLLVVKQKRREIESTIYLVPEFVTMTGLEQSELKDMQLKQALSRLTIKPPDERVQSISDFVRKYMSTSKSETAKQEIPKWSIKYYFFHCCPNSTSAVLEPIKFPGIKLEPEVVRFKDQDYNRDPPDWSRMYTAKYVNAPRLAKWRIFSLYEQKDERRSFLKVFQDTLEPYGIYVDNPIEHDVRKAHDFETVIKDEIRESDQFIMVMLPRKLEREYQAIKAILCGGKISIPSQVVVATTVQKNARSVCNKLAAQITSKLGGIPWQVNVSNFCQAPIMVCGLTTGSAKGKTVVTLTASFNPEMAQYMSFSEYSETKDVQCLSSLLAKAGNSFYDKNNTLPQILVIYREGVGEGSLDKTIQAELEQILRIDNKIQIVYIIVNKKTNTKFFANDGRSNFNPPSGTVVDDVIVRRARQYFLNDIEFNVEDFYLVAQSATHGTVSPSHYYVFNKSNFLLKDIESLTYKLTHMYYNWTGTVAIPAPLMYARKLAQLLGQKPFNPSVQLSNQLFFL